MTCGEAAKYLMAYLDSALDAKTECDILEHLETCPACAARFASEERLERALKERLTTRATDAALWQRVLAPLKISRRKPALVTAAAILAMAVALVWLWARPENITPALVKIHRELANGKESFRALDSLPEGATAFFQNQIGVALKLPADGGMKIHGVRVCRVGRASVGVIVASSENKAVTFFIVPRARSSPIGVVEGEIGRLNYALTALGGDAVLYAVSEIPCKRLAAYLAAQNFADKG